MVRNHNGAVEGIKRGRPVLLVNANRLVPPVAPIGLELVASDLRRRRIPFRFLDLAWEGRPEAALAAALGEREYGLVAITVRNTDDCYFKTREFLLPRARRLVAVARRASAAPVAVGGVGYSVFPGEALAALGADFGIAGDGEGSLAALWRALSRRGRLDRVPGLVRLDGGRTHLAPLHRADLAAAAPPARDIADNRRYLREGGMVGFETKRGCPMRCVYCADPVAKGRRVRARDPRAVAAEIDALAAAGVDVFHTCDSEFNVPAAHAAAVCRELAARGLGGRIRWYAYATPLGFTPRLARLMRGAGCVGVNLGVDSGDRGMLARLGRDHSPGDVAAAVRAARGAGLTVMVDLLVGGPGESRRSVSATIGLMKRIAPDRVGLALGLRIYPGTALAGRLGALPPGGFQPPRPAGLLRPAFYLSPALGPDPEGLLLEMVGGDERFFTAGLGEEASNYNYSGHGTLVQAIREGHRGAFWDILRRLQGEAGAAGRPPARP